MRCLYRYLPAVVPYDCPGCARGSSARASQRARGESRSGSLRFQTAAAHQPSHAQRRRPLRSLRPLRRTLPHRRMGHAEVPVTHLLCGHPASHNIMRSRVNDFAIKLANVNGTGSASANGLIMQAIFRMGVPVSGKNLFLSNIQGLPTWYEVRVNRDGYTARALDYDLMIAMNAQTYDRDVSEVRPGGYLLYDSSWPLDASLIRDDITYIGVPLAQLCNETFREARERVLMK